MIGEVVGQYLILEKLGEGGMGEVYKAEDLMVKRPVAIKMLRKDLASLSGVVERFRVEAQSLARLNHPNIAALYSFFQNDRGYIMVIEYIPGLTLEQTIRQRGPLDPQTAVRVASEALDGLGHAHSQGILHRDVKPANILISDRGPVKVTDFGIARIVGSAALTKRGKVVGTMEYMAPERLQGQTTDQRADLYSLGAVIYEMLTGHAPFEFANEIELIQAHISQPTPPLSRFGKHVPEGLEAAIRKALAKRPEDRFKDAAEFRDALQASLTAAPPIPAPRTAVAPAQSPMEAQVSNPLSQFLNTELPIPGIPKPYNKAPFLLGVAFSFVFVMIVIAYVASGPASSPATPAHSAPTAIIPENAPPVAAEPAPDDWRKHAVPIPDPVAQTPSPPPPSQPSPDKRRDALRALGVEDDSAQAPGGPGTGKSQ